MKINICLLWHGSYPWDVRIEKFCKSLVTAGHDVSIICRAKEGYENEEIIQKIKIYRVSPPEWLQKEFTTFPLFFNPTWLISLRKLLARINPDLLIIRDIPICLPAARLAKKMGVPAILDMAENYPAALKAYNNMLYKPFLFNNAALPKYYEKACLLLMSHVLVVSSEQKKRLVSLGISADRISIVMNTPDLKYYNTLLEKNKQKSDNSGSRIKLIYIGMIDHHRGVDVLIKGVSLATKKNPHLHLKIIGSGTELERVRALTRKLGADKYIEFTDWLPFERIPSSIDSSDIGIIPHLKSDHTDTTIPNKLFDYMSFGKPVISSNLDPVTTIINQTGCGIVFESGNPEDLARMIAALDEDTLRSMSLKGMNAVKEKYNWRSDEQVLLESVRHVQSMNGKRIMSTPHRSPA